MGTSRSKWEGRDVIVPLDPTWFTPVSALTAPASDLGLLSRIATTPCLLEPFRNAPTRQEVRSCLLKLLWIQEDQRRKTEAAGNSQTEKDLPKLWILAATATKPVVSEFGGQQRPDCETGIYFLPEAHKAAFVAIDELPQTEATLWLRILGRGETQNQAIREVLVLPAIDPKRDQILRLLASWKVSIEIGELVDFAEGEEIMALSEAFVAWEQETKGIARQEAKIDIAINLLQQGLPLTSIAQATGLTIAQLQQLQAQSGQN